MTMLTMLVEEPERIDDNLWPGLDRFAKRLAPVRAVAPDVCAGALEWRLGSGKTTLLLAWSAPSPRAIPLAQRSGSMRGVMKPSQPCWPP